jgi:hypothetical protein
MKSDMRPIKSIRQSISNRSVTMDTECPVTNLNKLIYDGINSFSTNKIPIDHSY